jgi:VanZ family protein
MQRLTFVVLAIIAFAAVDEWLQRLAPGRVASLADFVRDVLGVGIESRSRGFAALVPA